MKSIVIAISGIDGSGKSTCAEYIKKILEDQGFKTIIIDAMKNGPVIEKLKQIAHNNNMDLRKCFPPDVINMSWTFDLIYNYVKYVEDYSQQGYAIIFHRSELCCRVYSRLFDVNNSIVDDFLDRFGINYTSQLFLEIDPSVAYDRIKVRNLNNAITEKEQLEYLIEASNLYNVYVEQRQDNIYRINANVSQASLFEQLTIWVKKLLESSRDYVQC